MGESAYIVCINHQGPINISEQQVKKIGGKTKDVHQHQPDLSSVHDHSYMGEEGAGLLMLHPDLSRAGYLLRSLKGSGGLLYLCTFEHVKKSIDSREREKGIKQGESRKERATYVYYTKPCPLNGTAPNLTPSA